MAIGVVSENDFELEMKRLGIVRSVEQQVEVEVRDLVRGRGNKPEVPMELRALIASDKTAGAASKELQAAYDVSASSISAYGNAATSTASYNDKKPELVEAIDAMQEKITSRASKTILQALDAITSDKVKELSPLKAADLAAKMSNVHRNMRKEEVAQVNNNQIIVFKPRTREEDEFEVLQVVED